VRGALAALAGVVVVLASACGGSAGERLSKADFQSQGNTICSKYQKQLNAVQMPSSLAEIPGLVDQALAIIDKEIAEIKALRPPKELQSSFDAMIAASDDTKQAADDLSAAAKANDQQAVQKALDAGKAASDKADQAAGQLGLTTCTG
jgi:hypothetical protein